MQPSPSGATRTAQSRKTSRRRLAAAVVAGMAMVSVAGALPAGAQTTGLTYTGRAAAVYTPTGVTLLGAQVIAPETVICQAGPLPAAGGSFTACNGNVGVPIGSPTSIGTVNVLNESVSGTGGTSSASSEVASVDLFPNPVGGTLGLGGVNIGGTNLHITATVLNADTEVTCTTHSESASLLTLNLNGTPLTFDPNVTNQTQNVLNGAAIITTGYTTYDPATNTSTASPLRIEFPANGSLSGIITGTIFVSYAQSDLHGCPPGEISEVPMTLVLPLAAIGIFGGAYLVMRRRSRVATA